MRTACVPASNGMPSTAALASARSQDCGAPMKVFTGAKTASSKIPATGLSSVNRRGPRPIADEAPGNLLAVSICSRERQGREGAGCAGRRGQAPCVAGFRLPTLPQHCSGRVAMDSRKAELLQRIESDRDVLIDFLRGFIRCPSPNPPGDTREAAGHIRNLLDRRGVDYRVIAPQEMMLNIVA